MVTMDTMNMTIGPPQEQNITMTTVLPALPRNTMHLEYIGYVFVPFFLVVGVTGNILTIVVMRSKFFRKLPVSYILIALAFSDTVLNVLLPFNKMFVRQLLGFDIRSFTEAGCKTFYWAFRAAKMTSSWLVVFICIERFIAVKFPLRASTWITKRHAIYGIIFIYGFMTVYIGIWVSFADRRLMKGGKLLCIPNTRPPGLVELTRGFLIVGLSFYAFLPSVVLIILNYFIISTLLKARKAREKFASLINDATYKTTGMLIAINIAFMVLVLPIATAHLITHVRDTNIFEAKDAPTVIYREIAQLMEQMNYSINFFLYVCSSSSYRNKVLVILRIREESSMQSKSSSPWVSGQNVNVNAKRKISAGSLDAIHLHRVSAGNTPLGGSTPIGGRTPLDGTPLLPHRHSSDLKMPQAARPLLTSENSPALRTSASDSLLK